MKPVEDKYHLAWNALKSQINYKLREYQNAESLGLEFDEYISIEIDTLNGVLQLMEGEEKTYGIKKR